jgi:PEP-CTERM motif-containing protein
MDRIISMLGIASGIVLVNAAAVAVPRVLPEPATMSIFGLGIAGAFVARKLINRK